MTKRTEDFNRFLLDHVNLDESHYDTLNDEVKAVTEFFDQHLDGYQSIEKQGSYALGTSIRPVKGHEYDADLLLLVGHDPSKAPKEYVDEAYQCMRESQIGSKIQRRTRCVVVDYDDDFHLDIVPCLAIEDGQYICNRITDMFEVTDGTGFRDWFNDKNILTNGNLKHATRLLKYLRDHKQTFTAPSILLTTLIGNAVYDDGGNTGFNTVPDTLVTVCNHMWDFLCEHPCMPDIANPVLPEEDFTRHWDQVKYRRFRDIFGRYTDKVNTAYWEDDHNKSVILWRELFGDDFGSLPNRGGGAAPATTSRSVVPRRPYAR